MNKLDQIEKAVNNAVVLRRTPEKPLLEMTEMRLLVRAVRHLGDVRNELEQFIASSSGVDGLHLNGDLATWEELITGSVDQPSWLDAFSAPQDDVLELITEQEA